MHNPLFSGFVILFINDKEQFKKAYATPKERALIMKEATEFYNLTYIKADVYFEFRKIVYSENRKIKELDEATVKKYSYF